jgi:hypothetical protein
MFLGNRTIGLGSEVRKMFAFNSKIFYAYITLSFFVSFSLLPSFLPSSLLPSLPLSLPTFLPAFFFLRSNYIPSKSSTTELPLPLTLMNTDDWPKSIFNYDR